MYVFISKYLVENLEKVLMEYKFQNLLSLLELHGIDVRHAVKRVGDLQNGKLVPVGSEHVVFNFL